MGSKGVGIALGCVVCAPGTYTAIAGVTSTTGCSNCAANTYSTVGICNNCPDGQYSAAGASICINCLVGNKGLVIIILNFYLYHKRQ